MAPLVLMLLDFVRFVSFQDHSAHYRWMKTRKLWEGRQTTCKGIRYSDQCCCWLACWMMNEMLTSWILRTTTAQVQRSVC